MICELLLAGALLSADVNVLPLERPAESGKLVELDSRKVVIEAEGEQISYDLAELISVAPADAKSLKGSPNVYVWLIDGTELAANTYTVADGKARIALRGAEGEEPQTVEAPTSSIVGVRLRPADEALASQWTSIADAEATGDRIVIRRTNTVEGAMVVSLDTLEGVIYNVTDETVDFSFDGATIHASREKLQGLFYFHAAAGRPEDPVCRVSDAAGSRWNVRSVQLEGESLNLVSTTGVRATLPVERLLKLDFSIGKILYLSDADPETVEWTPFIGPASSYEVKLYAPRRDIGWGGAKLEIPGTDKHYEKGLQVFSRTELVYRVPEGFKRFLATAGIGNASRSGSNVHLVISGDGDKLLEQQVTRGDEPLKIDLDLTGVRRLTVLVDYGKGGPICDHVNLGNARITK
jgi:hypothetical protein